MISVYALIAVILMFIMAMFGFMVVLRRIEKNLEIFETDLNHGFNSDMREIINSLYNARKRDEKLLRRITRQDRYLLESMEIFKDMFVIFNGKLNDVTKQCRGIDGVTRQCVNNDLEMRASLSKANKSLKECERILDLFEAVTKKVKSGGLK